MLFEAGLRGLYKTPFEEYWDKHFNDCKYPDYFVGISIGRLNDETRARMNTTAIMEAWHKVEGLDYGWDNMIFNAFDTYTDLDYGRDPPLTSPRLYEMAISLDGTPWLPPYFSDWAALPGLNQRMGLDEKTPGPEFFAHIDKEEKYFWDVVIMPELESYKYDGKTMLVCSTLVAYLWEKGGVFGPHQVEPAEFTPRDIYSSAVFNETWAKNLPCGRDNKPWCQVAGNYHFELDTFNSVPIYDHMNERCSPQRYETPNC